MTEQLKLAKSYTFLFCVYDCVKTLTLTRVNYDHIQIQKNTNLSWNYSFLRLLRAVLVWWLGVNPDVVRLMPKGTNGLFYLCAQSILAYMVKQNIVRKPICVCNKSQKPTAYVTGTEEDHRLANNDQERDTNLRPRQRVVAPPISLYFKWIVWQHEWR